MGTVQRRKQTIGYMGGTDTMFEDSQLKSGKWIVGSIDKSTGRVSFSTNPKPHELRVHALDEAKRLARQHPNKKFMAVKIDGIASAKDIVVE